MKVMMIKTTGTAIHHHVPTTIAEWLLAQYSIVPIVGTLMSVNPSTASVTERPIDQIMLAIAVEKTIGMT